MKAVCWHGKQDMRVEQVPDPEILNPQDAIIRVTSTAICGSDLHLYDNLVPGMMRGDILGHEFMGEVVDIGRDVHNLKVGDRVVVPFPISCGQCWFCQHELHAQCDNSNPNAHLLEGMYGFSGAGIFGYSHLFGGYAGGQAEYVRVPFADVGPFVMPAELPDEKVLFLTDILPTGYQAAERADIAKGDTVAVWGCGPVGQFAIQSAYLLGAERVIALDRVPERLAMARDIGHAEVFNVSETDDTVELLKQLTGGRGPDVCIDAVGMEAHGADLLSKVDRVKQAMRLEMDRPVVLRQIMQACRKGGTVSVIGVYGGFVDKFPMGSIFGKALTIRTGQCDVHKYVPLLIQHIMNGDVDPSAIITHELPLAEAARAYDLFARKADGCVKVVLKP